MKKNFKLLMPMPTKEFEMKR